MEENNEKKEIYRQGPEPNKIIEDGQVRIDRPTWDEYFCNIARLVASRATCLRRSVGAVVVKDKQIMATGYNGAPQGLEHCEVTGCLRDKLGIPSGEYPEVGRGLHAEQNAFLQAAKHGITIAGGTLYSTIQPCNMCAKMIINVGIKRVVFEGDYPDYDRHAVLPQAGNLKA